MKALRIGQIAVLVIALLAMVFVYFAFREHFGWLLVGFGIGLPTGVILAILLPRGLRKVKKSKQ